MIEVKVRQFLESGVQGLAAVVIERVDTKALLSMSVTSFEAVEGVMALTNVKYEMPASFEVVNQAFCVLGAAVEKVVLEDIVDQNVKVKIFLKERDGTVHAIDSTPGTGIALALRAGVSVYAEEIVFEKYEILRKDASEKLAKPVQSEKKKTHSLEDIDPTEFGPHKH